MVGPEAKVDRAHLLETAQQQTGGDKQHQSHGKLCNHQHRSQMGMDAAAAAGASTFFQGFANSSACGTECRNQPAQQAGENRQPESEPDDTPVKRYGADAWKRFRQYSDTQTQNNCCQTQSKGSPADAQ